MATPEPTLPPRDEAFCRHVARGGDLVSAAIQAGYAPPSARRHGSELYARDDVRRRIIQLEAERVRAEDEMREAYIRRLDDLYDACVNHGERRTALRALTIQLQLRGLDARSMNRRARAGQDDRVRDDREQEGELFERMRAELREEIRAEVLAEVAAARREARMQDRKQRHEPAETPQTMTKRDIPAKTAAPAPGRGFGPLDRALAGSAGKAGGGTLALNGILGRAGFVAAPHGRAAWLDDAVLPCLGAAAGAGPAAGAGAHPLR